MALRKSQVLLPDVFQTNKNNKFLNATVDQLISEPNLTRINSYIGRQQAASFQVGDSYVQEIDKDRQNYQLEPAVVYRSANKSIESLTGYIDFINQLRYNNVNVDTHADLNDQEYYNYSGFNDLDKLVNYGEYFWLPAGPDSVQVFNSVVDMEKDFAITRRTVAGVDEYSIDNSDNENPTITIARGGSYTFSVQQSGHPFWIQTEPGLSGISNYGSNVSTRKILGLTNNGEDNGTITFNVPATNAQNIMINATQAANPDFATDLAYKDIHNVPYQTLIDTHGGIDVQTEIDGKTLVFVSPSTVASDWEQGAPFDAYGYDDDDHPWDETTTLPVDVRYDVYSIAVNNVGGVDTVQLTRSTDWPVAEKVKIKQGNLYGNREFYKNASGVPELIEPYTAGLNTLYYQDATNELQFGKIQIVDEDVTAAINVTEDILNKQSFTSANSVKFTNGLKVEFNSNVTPALYGDREYYVEGVGQPGGIQLVAVDEMITPEKYTNSTSDGFDSVAYDAGGWDGTLNAPKDQDYITINRASPDRNAWSRGNRWFHREVIEATATYNNYTADLDDTARAKRPIIEFYSGLELFNMGTTSVAPVTVVDTTQTDALSNVNGTPGYFADGIDLQQDSTVIFSADTDTDVRTKIYRVDIISADQSAATTDSLSIFADSTTVGADGGNTSGKVEIINLVDIGTVVDTNCVLSTLGATNQGKQFYLDDTVWTEAQQKTTLNQDPLFDIFDPDHTSFSDTTKYPSSNFTGNKLFSYKRNNNNSPDAILNFGLSYQNFSTIGDIVFENNFDSDIFQYTKSTGNTNVIVRSGHAHQFDIDGNRVLYNGWTKTIENSTQYQIVTYEVSANELNSFEIGASVDTSRIREPLQVSVNGQFIYKTDYTHLIQQDREYVVFTTALNENDVVVIKFISANKSPNSFYEVPDNLQNNAGNATFDTLTLGQMRNHAVQLSRQIKTLLGVAPGKSNLRDTNFRAYPGNILQHSAGMILPMHLLSNTEANTIDSINFVKNEYTKFKNRFIDNINKLDLDLTDPAKCVDDILLFMAGTKTSTFPFYFSDMVPWGNQKSQLVYTIDDAAETEFEFTTQFDLTSIGSRGVLVYHTPISTGVPNLLVEGQDYTFDTTEAKVVLTTTNLDVALIGLSVDDKITIVEYTNTHGSFIPPTPSAMGLYPKFIPNKYADNTYTVEKTVIQGHDGSVWIGWDDIRDNVVLELEKRIFNNIKTQYNKDLFDITEVVPGYFRSTLTDFAEANNIIRSYFGEWALRNKVRMQKNDTVEAGNPFTWNYRNSVYKIDGSRIPGHWRAIYNWFFDTDTPHTKPWQMLGVKEKPLWWDQRYGVAPYTSGNTVLWEDLRDGKVYTDATGTTFTIDTRRQRPDLMSIIPVDEQGQLRSPAEFLVQDAFSTNVSDDWAFSDGSPGETAWRRSSEYPYVVQILAATIKAAKYGTLMFDTNLFEKNAQYDQILQKFKSYRPGIVDFELHGQTTGAEEDNDTHSHKEVEGYNQFISEYLRYNGFSVDDAINRINNLELNLCYGMAGFTDKQYLKVVAESVTPSSQSENIFIPDEDLNIYTKKSLPLERVVYSGVQIIQRADGYEIQGYDIKNPFFKIIPSSEGTDPARVSVGETVYLEYKDFENRIVNIPYGTIITNRQQVFDFLVSYQRYLLSRGFVFDGTTGVGEKNDFISAGKEFAFWTDQKWPLGSVIVISPYSDTLTLNRAYATIDDIRTNGEIKDANGSIINPKFYDVSRIDNVIEIKVDAENTQLYSVQLDPIQHEHVLVFNNTTIFNDIIYQPELGNRHSRLKLIGARSGDWNGTLHAPGFFINEDKINVWATYTDYKKGDIVSFQGTTYVAKYAVDGSTVFDYNDWTVADNIKTGLVKNLANKATQFKDFFETDNLNLEDGVDKLGKGIIGFNEKDYLAGLGLDDVSQVKFYQGMLKQKGTGAAINKLIDAKLTNLDQTIDYFEEWAFRVGEYGSIDSNQIIETIIPEQEATNNPFVLHYHAAGDLPSTTELGHYHVQEKDLYKKPNNYTGDVFSVRDSNTNTLKDLDSAGYARLDDVDFTVFNTSELLGLSDRIEELGKGKKIWIATDDSNTWSIRRIDETLSTVTSVESTGNGYLIYTTDVNHGLVEDDYVIIRAAQPIGKVAKIFEVSAPNKFTIVDAETEAEITDINIPMYKLSNVRFAQPSSLSTYTPVSGWNNKELVWVDKDNNGKWQVLQNTRPWTTTGVKTAASINADDKYGTSVALNRSATVAIVGAPDNGYGLVTPYVRSEGGVLVEGNSFAVATIGNSVDSFGHSVAAGVDYVAVGAPETQSGRGAVFIYYVDSSGQFNRRPAIRPAGLGASDKFGTSVVMSGNGRYLFVGAPGSNDIYCYTQVTIPVSSQEVKTVTGDASATKVFALGFTPINILALNITDENGNVYLPTKDFTISGSDITFVAAPANGLDVVIRQEDYYALSDMLVPFDASTGDNYGFAIDCDYQGRTVVIGAPNAAVAGTDSTVFGDAGEVSIQSQVVQQFAGDGITKGFTTTEDLQTQIFVEVDGILQTETNNPDVPVDNDGSSEGFYTRSAKTITFKYTPASGARIVVYTGTFIEKQKIDQNITGQTVTEGEQFGYSVAVDSDATMVAIGSPGEDETNPNTGSVFIFQDTGKNYGTVTTNVPHAQTAGDTFYLNNKLITVSSSSDNPANLSGDILGASLPGVTSSVNSLGQVVITSTSTETNNKLTINPGSGQMFTRDDVFEIYKFTQKISHPQAFENENFGRTVAFDKNVEVGIGSNPGTRNLVIASDKASTMLAVGFDVEQDSNSEDYLEATTTYDSNGTTFTDRRTQSGAGYLYELLDSNVPTLANPSQMVFGQALKSTNVAALDQFGASAAFSDNRIFIGAPQDSGTYNNSGSVYEFNNNTRASSWATLRSQGDRVDVTQINRVALYNKKDGQIKVFLDYLDSTKGKIPGVAQSELSFVSHNDPALYAKWNYKQNNTLWWDTSTVHYLLSEQGELDFRTNYWNVAFPGSSIDVYEWIESPVPPEQYTGEGTVKDVNKFSTSVIYNNSSNSTQTYYYFWVSGRTDIPVEAEFRTISADSVTKLIEDPKAQGVPYIAIVDKNAIALYNCKQYFADSDVVLSVNYDVVKNEGVLHSEYELFGRGNVDQDIPARMYTKLVDSLAGSDSVGNLVPDPFLSEVEKYGVLTQPRQGMFVNRAAALKVLTQYCNSILVKAPFARLSSVSRLLSSENIPTVNSGEYNISVDSIAERDYLNTAILTTGYKVLVLEDETQSNYWAIYTLQEDKSYQLTNIQGYNTADYWDYATYYATGYDGTTVPKYQVTLEADLLTLTDAVTGDIAKVTSNDEGNFSMFVKTDTGWDEVVIERGTLQFNDSLYSFNTANSNFQATGFDNDAFDFGAFDKVPADEIRQIVDALKNDLFIGDYEINMNELFFRLMEYAINENNFSQDWLFKSSFITVAHKIRSLDQYNTFKFDNTNFIEDFINEVKPYKTKIREYVSKYDKVDTYGSDTTDFDIHSFYDENNLYFRKPSGDFAGDEILQTQGLNKPWSENYGYSLDSIEIVNAGSGYVTDPTITISAPDLADGVQATAVAITNGVEIVNVNMTNKGSGYTSEPTITVDGSAGSGLLLSPRLVNTTIRSFDTTIKFDRITYSSAIKDWTKNTAYVVDDIIAYQDTVTKTQEVYTCIVDFTSGSTFSIENTTGVTVLEVKADNDFTNAADRISAYYYPTSGMIGDDIELLQNGIGYGGTKITGPGFDQNPGFDSANFDVIGFDDIQIDDDGIAVISSIDTVFRGTDFDQAGIIGDVFVEPGYLPPGYLVELSLGVAPESIIVDGAGFVDTYNSHAPEELIPGRIFDTLDMEVYTHSSNDYEGDGNGAEIQYTSYTDPTGTLQTFSYGDPNKSEDDFVYLIVYINETRQFDFTNDGFRNNNIRLPNPLGPTDILHIYAFSQTGENMIGNYTYVGDGSTIGFVLPNVPERTQQTLIYVDGQEVGATFTTQDNRSLMTLSSVPNNGAHIHVFVFNQAEDRKAATKFATQTLETDGTTTLFGLSYMVEGYVEDGYLFGGAKAFYAPPGSANSVLEVDNKRIRPVNSVYHTADGSSLQFATPQTCGEGNIVFVGAISVAILRKDGTPALSAVRDIDYTISTGTQFVTMTTAPNEGDIVIVTDNTSADFTISLDGESMLMSADVPQTASSDIKLQAFSNHDPLRIQTKVYVGQGTGSTTIEDAFDEVNFDTAGFDRQVTSGTVGTYAIDRTATNVNHFWITVDGKRLHPGEFTVSGKNVIMSEAVQDTIGGSSVVIITHFTENIIQYPVGFRIFQDMNGNVEYLRLAKDNQTFVTETVEITDTKIYVEDASVLPFANVNASNPGVVFIGGERITYWEVSLEDNYITNLRRGTSGTGMLQRITPGFIVVDGSKDQELPDSTTHTKVWYDAGIHNTPANGLGIQQATTTNANFLREKQAQLPNYRLELNEKNYFAKDYVVTGYAEDLI